MYILADYPLCLLGVGDWVLRHSLLPDFLLLTVLLLLLLLLDSVVLPKATL
jgi:hypothetical protein